MQNDLNEFYIQLLKFSQPRINNNDVIMPILLHNDEIFAWLTKYLSSLLRKQNFSKRVNVQAFNREGLFPYTSTLSVAHCVLFKFLMCFILKFPLEISHPILYKKMIFFSIPSVSYNCYTIFRGELMSIAYW